MTALCVGRVGGVRLGSKSEGGRRNPPSRRYEL